MREVCVEGGNERGAAMTEAAIVVPILLLLVMGVIQYGVALSTSVSLKHAAAVAARHAVLDGATDADVEQAARDAVALTLNPAYLSTVSVTTQTVNSANATQVALTYDLQAIMPYVLPAGVLTLTASSTMR